MTYPNCPQCQSSLTYHDGTQLVCPECAHEWQEGDADNGHGEQAAVVKDANGAVLNDGDTVVLIKDLKVKGSSMVSGVGRVITFCTFMPLVESSMISWLRA